jgi:hypothetical protein
MTYVAGEARQELLDTVAQAADTLSAALASLGGAFDMLDDHAGEQLEDQLFRPLQVAYGRARRTHTEFATRVGLPTRQFAPADVGHPSQGVMGFLDAAVESIEEADDILSELQDSLLPVEVGDQEVRSGISEVRRIIGALPEKGRRFEGLVGR